MATFTENFKRTKKAHQHQVIIPTTQKGERGESDLDAYGSNEDFSLDRDLYIAPMDENMDQRVLLAQERLSRLRREADDIEREKLALEELRIKQQGFMQGRVEMEERLSRATAILDREIVDTRRKVEQMLVMRDGFAEHLDAVQALSPEEWNRTNLHSELSRALAVIEDARLEYDRNMTRLQSFTQVPVVAESPSVRSESPSAHARMPVGITKEAFRQWAFYGLAFSAPALVVVGVVALLRLIF